MPQADAKLDAIVHRYRQDWAKSNQDVPLDAYIQDTARWPEAERKELFLQLFAIEREFRTSRKIPTHFESYFDRSWFPTFVDEIVQVMIRPDYLWEKRLGSGGQGRVYLVRNRSVHNRREAMKIFLPIDPAFLREFARDDFERLQIRFERESEVLAKLRLEHLPQVYAQRNMDGLRFFTMQYIVGQTLDKHVASGKPVPLQQAVEWICMSSRTLSSLHSQNVLHRDFKPSNVLIDKEGKLFLVDFGLIKVMPGGRPGGTSMEMPSLTATNFGCGSEGYVSPEQSRAGANVGAATDIFSLGATFFHLVNGAPPMDIQLGPRKWQPHIPSSLKVLGERCLAADPDLRPTADEVTQTLQDWLDAQTRKSTAITSRFSRRTLFGFTGTALIGSGLAYFFLRPRDLAIPEMLQLANQLTTAGTQFIFEHGYVQETVSLSQKINDNSGWFNYSLVQNSNRLLEMHTHAQAIRCLLESPHLQDEHRKKLMISLQLIYNYKPTNVNDLTDGRPLRFEDNRPIGWTSRNIPRLYIIPPVAWALSAQAKAALRNLLPKSTLNSAIQKTLDIASNYEVRSLGRSHWSIFPSLGSANTSQSMLKGSLYATGLMLQALLDLRLAFRSKQLDPINNVFTLETCEQKIREASAWLWDKCDPMDGWREEPAEQPREGIENLGLFLYAMQLRTALESRVGLPLHNPSWDQLIANRLLAFRSVPLERPNRECIYYIPSWLKAEARDVKFEMLWYPWALYSAALLIQYAQSQGKAPEPRVVQFLGYLLEQHGQQSLDTYQKYQTYQLAETVMGLASIEEVLQKNSDAR